MGKKTSLILVSLVPLQQGITPHIQVNWKSQRELTPESSPKHPPIDRKVNPLLTITASCISHTNIHSYSVVKWENKPTELNIHQRPINTIDCNSISLKVRHQEAIEILPHSPKSTHTGPSSIPDIPCMGSCRWSTSNNPCPTRANRWREATAAKMLTTGSGLKRTRLLNTCEPLSYLEGSPDLVSQTDPYLHHTIQIVQRAHMQSGVFPSFQVWTPYSCSITPNQVTTLTPHKSSGNNVSDSGCQAFCLILYTHLHHSVLQHPCE